MGTRERAAPPPRLPRPAADGPGLERAMTPNDSRQCRGLALLRRDLARPSWSPCPAGSRPWGRTKMRLPCGAATTSARSASRFCSTRLVLAPPVAWAAWPVTHEDVFRDFRDYGDCSTAPRSLTRTWRCSGPSHRGRRRPSRTCRDRGPSCPSRPRSDWPGGAYFSFLSVTSMSRVPALVANSVGRSSLPGGAVHHLSVSPANS